ncbi:hypothetical protein ACFX13_003259 [Malus domestica]
MQWMCNHNLQPNNLEKAERENEPEKEEQPGMASSAAIEGVHETVLRSVTTRKTKPVSLLRQVYDTSHRCFGENYVQEIVDKAPQLLEDIEWHFFGHLQSNKVKSLLSMIIFSFSNHGGCDFA